MVYPLKSAIIRVNSQNSRHSGGRELLFPEIKFSRVEREARGERPKPMTAAPLSLVEPDVRISRIRLSP